MQKISYRKVFVKVRVEINEEGEVRPLTITFENGRTYTVDRLCQRCRACASKVGGTGIRYTVEIQNKKTFLFEDEGRWYVEAKAPAEI